MANLPPFTYFWRQKGGSDDSWIENDSGTFSPEDGTEIEVVSVGPSAPTFIVADSVVSLASISDQSFEIGTTGLLFIANATGTNVEYSLSGPSWLAINAASGDVTVSSTGQSEGIHSVEVTASNSKYSDSANVSVTIEAVAGTGQTLNLTQGNVTTQLSNVAFARQLGGTWGPWIVQPAEGETIEVLSETPSREGDGSARRNGSAINLDWDQTGDPRSTQPLDGRDSYYSDTGTLVLPAALPVNGTYTKIISATHPNPGTDDEDRAGWPEETATIYVVDDISAIPNDVLPAWPLKDSRNETDPVFSFWQDNSDTVALSMPSEDVTSLTGLKTVSETLDYLENWQGLSTYSQLMSDGGYQAWWTKDSGRVSEPGDNGSNYGQFIMQQQEHAMFHLIGNVATTDEKARMLRALAYTGSQYLQAGQLVPNMEDELPSGMGGHGQMQALTMLCAALISPDAPTTEFDKLVPANQFSQVKLWTQEDTDSCVPHNSDDGFMDFRIREVLDVDTSTVPNTVDVESFSSDRFRLTHGDKTLTTVDGTKTTETVYAETDLDDVDDLVPARRRIRVVDASVFSVGDSVYLDPHNIPEVGYPVWNAGGWLKNRSHFDFSWRTAYMRTNNRWAGIAAFVGAIYDMLPNGVQSQSIPMMRWTNARASGLFNSMPPFDSVMAEEFWNLRGKTLVDNAIGLIDYPKPPEPTVPEGFFILNDAKFKDTNPVPSNTNVIEYEARFQAGDKALTNNELMGQLSAGGFRADGAGRFDISAIEDGTGNIVLSGTDNQTVFIPGIVHKANVKVDFGTGEVTIIVDDITVSTTPMTSTSGVAQSNREIIFGGTFVDFPKNWFIDYFKVWLTTNGERTLHKEISLAAQGSVEGINTDPWHGGGNVTAGTSVSNPNVAYDGGFDDPTVWSMGQGITFEDSQLVGNNVPQFEIIDGKTGFLTPVEENTVYEVSIDIIKPDTNGGTARLQMSYYDANDVTSTNLGFDRIPSSTFAVDSVRTVSGQITTPAGTKFINPRIQFTTDLMDPIFDNLVIRKIS